ELPHDPYIGNDGSWIYDAADKATGTSFRIIRSDIHNYSFVEEDTFDLGLMDESFMSSEFIDTQLSRKQTHYKGYPALDCKYKDKDGQLYMTRFIIQGPHYYTLVAHSKQETAAMSSFLNSFEIKPFVYREARLQKDTSLYFTVNTPVFPEEKKIKLDMPRYSRFGDEEEEDESEEDQLQGGTFRNKIITNDTTGEKIYIIFSRSPRYYYTKDSSGLSGDKTVSYMGDTTWIVRLKKKAELPNKMKVWETIISDTGSSRTLWNKTFYMDGIGFSLLTQMDTLSQPSSFLKNFFDTFMPVDTLKGMNPFVKKSKLFFEDYLSKDSVLHKRAVKHISEIVLDSADLPQLKQLIAEISWEEKNYLDTKEALIRKAGDIKTTVSARYLKELYYALDDTVELQYAVLESLLQQKTPFAYTTFRDIINNEPPVLDFSNNDYGSYRRRLSSIYDEDYQYDDGKFLDELSDSLKLTKTILSDLLPLLNLDDYKTAIMSLLGEMVDSNLLKPQDYEAYLGKFLIEAKQTLKKQSIAEKRKAIEKAEESKTVTKAVSYSGRDEDNDYGNADLSLYATLLMPFWEINPAVQPLIQQMLRSSDKRLKYNTMMLLLDKKKAYPDTLMKYFAAMDEYRYELYTDLKGKKQLDKFPVQYNTHIDLGKSALLNSKSYGKPDTIVFAERLPTAYKGKTGFIYFFRYKEKKDDLNWKLATVGLVPENPKEFEYEDSTSQVLSKRFYSPLLNMPRYNKFDFTSLTDTKIKEGDSLQDLLKKELKKMLYSRRKSAKQFYEDEKERTMAMPGYGE
ncbi:MAG: hypothetical protein ABL876_15395, partial [Chitinophagaceae bacterium]